MSHLGEAEQSTTPGASGRSDRWKEPEIAFPLLAGGLSFLALVLGYVIMRWGPSPVAIMIVVVGGVLVALALVGYVGARRGHAAPFVATALLLPYLLAGVVGYASVQRAASEVEGWFESDDDGSSESDIFTDEPVEEGSAVEGAGEDGSDVAEEDDGPPTLPLDGGSYTWASGVTMSLSITRTEPWGTTDDYCGDGSCGVSNPDDLRLVLEYEVSVPDTASEPFDASSCPGQLHIASGNDDDSIISVAGDYASYLEGKILPGQTKTGADEYSIERSAVGEEFYVESMCGDPMYETDGPVYFTGTISD